MKKTKIEPFDESWDKKSESDEQLTEWQAYSFFIVYIRCRHLITKEPQALQHHLYFA